jgi:hypothetical protein
MCLVHAINPSPSAFLFTFNTVSSKVFESTVGTTGSTHYAEYKAKRVTIAHDFVCCDMQKVYSAKR